MLLTRISVPFPFIKAVTHGLIHTVIDRSFIDIGRSPPVKGCTPRNIACLFNRFDLIFPALYKFFLLLFQGILPQKIPERYHVLYFFRQICHVNPGNLMAEPLDADQRSFRVVKSPDRCQCMGKFRPENMDHIRLICCKDLAETFFQTVVIGFRMSQILQKAEAPDPMYIDTV